MKTYEVSRKNVKQSLRNVSEYLKEQKVHVPHSVLLHLVSKFLFVKNWQTLEASFDACEQRSEFKEKVFIIDCKASAEEVKKTLLDCANKAPCLLNIKEIKTYGNRKEFFLDVVLQDGYRSNFLTAMMVFSAESKRLNLKEKWAISLMEIWDKQSTKENLMGLV